MKKVKGGYVKTQVSALKRQKPPRVVRSLPQTGDFKAGEGVTKNGRQKKDQKEKTNVHRGDNHDRAGYQDVNGWS